MEQTRFDRLTVQLADGTTRRTLLNRHGGASLAAVFLGWRTYWLIARRR